MPGQCNRTRYALYIITDGIWENVIWYVCVHSVAVMMDLCDKSELTGYLCIFVKPKHYTGMKSCTQVTKVTQK
jgi:hypothetical protein